MNEIVERIRKLLALSRSDNEHEASVAMEKAHELLAKHNLSMEAIVEPGTQEIEVRTLFDGRSVQQWRWKLMNLVAKNYYCRVLRMRQWRGSNFILLGRPVNTLVALSMFLYLEEAIQRLTKRRMSSVRSKRPVKYGLEFRLGVVGRLAYEFSQRREHYLHLNPDRDALALVSLDKREQAAIDHFLTSRGLEISDYKVAPTKHSKAFMAGIDDGGSIRLDDQLAGKSNNNRLLGT